MYQLIPPFYTSNIVSYQKRTKIIIDTLYLDSHDFSKYNILTRATRRKISRTYKLSMYANIRNLIPVVNLKTYKHGYINLQGDLVKNLNYDDVYILDDYFECTKYINGVLLYGLMNDKFEILIPVEYNKEEFNKMYSDFKLKEIRKLKLKNII